MTYFALIDSSHSHTLLITQHMPIELQSIATEWYLNNYTCPWDQSHTRSDAFNRSGELFFRTLLLTVAFPHMLNAYTLYTHHHHIQYNHHTHAYMHIDRTQTTQITTQTSRLPSTYQTHHTHITTNIHTSNHTIHHIIIWIPSCTPHTTHDLHRTNIQQRHIRIIIS